MNPFYELSEPQKRQLIDAEMLFSALEQTEADAIRHRGSMFWREQDGGRYLITLSAHSRQRSLGPASPENELKYERFTKIKAEVEARLKTLREKAEEYRRMNKALRVGRTPDILIEVLNAMMRYGVAGHFLVVGTHALFAYETAAGVRLPNDVMATQDADLLFDTGQRAAFMEVMKDRNMSFLGMARIRTVHPLDFARIKRELSMDRNRNPLKKTKDLAQADMVEKLVHECLPALGQGRPRQSGAYREGMKQVAEGRCGSSNFATNSAVWATSTPLRQTFNRFARNRTASTASRACSSTKLASQPASNP